MTRVCPGSGRAAATGVGAPAANWARPKPNASDAARPEIPEVRMRIMSSLTSRSAGVNDLLSRFYRGKPSIPPVAPARHEYFSCARRNENDPTNESRESRRILGIAFGFIESRVTGRGAKTTLASFRVSWKCRKGVTPELPNNPFASCRTARIVLFPFHCWSICTRFARVAARG